MTSSTLLAISVPKDTPAIEERRGKLYVTKQWIGFFEVLAARLSKLDEAAREYTPLAEDGSASSAQIATAINDFMSSATET